MPTKPAHTSARLARLSFGLLAAAFVSLAGCNIIGPAFVLVHGPEKVQAAYELDKTKSTVIFIDDRVPYTSRAVRDVIGRTAEEALLEEKALKDVVSGKSIQAVVARERFGKPMGIADVGKAVGADVVIYAWVDGFTLSQDGQTFTPSAALRVKVIDAATKERLFPKPDASEPWYPLVVQPPPQQGFRPGTPAEEDKARQDLARVVGLALARVFFEHEQPRTNRQMDEEGQ